MNSTLANVSIAAAAHLLVVDDRAEARESIADILRCAGHQVDSVSSASEALARSEDESYDLVITDLQMPGMSGLDLVIELERRRYGAQVVVATAYATVASAVEAMRHGAFDYLEKPFGVEQLESLVARALKHGRLIEAATGNAATSDLGPNMVGSSPAMRSLRAQIAQVGATHETALILGESGTGKEVVARALHAASPRRDACLVSLNCPVLSAQLMESELFGHEKGAFTGADHPRTGRFELANGGTILLDEVTEIDPGLQAKLLRVLQERSFERVGSSRSIEVDVRVLATSNRDLRAEVAAGRFREDLYFRLAVLPIQVPPLRDRREDIGELATHFLRRAAARLKRDPATLAPGALEMLTAYHWPGNVRELENVMTRASVLETSGTIAADSLRPWLLETAESPAPRAPEPVAVGVSLAEMERKMIESTLEHFAGHRAKTARALGIGIRTLSGKLRSYGYAPRAKPLGRVA